ncbi:nitrile hydratase accessory protein [Mycobacterium kyogaense]|uniref:nitrile hydratase accessory protein n=1 Tax=Mycobacterium kyogaense TaxID=2212479 RepID=UPI000DAEBF62|nr:nitrile hydratase accessory protein [Mycobacterium kyogaense]
MSKTLKDIAEDRRLAVDALVCDLPGRRTGERPFEQPWEIRAFALAVALHQAGAYQWAEFQGALIESIAAWERLASAPAASQWSYYEHWLAALERLVADGSVLDRNDIDARTTHVLASPPSRDHHRAVLEPIAIDKGCLY